MPMLKEMVPKAMEMWEEISPHMTAKTSNALANRLSRAAAYFPGDLADIHAEQVRLRARQMEQKGYHRKTILMELNALDDLFHVADTGHNPALEILEIYRTKPHPGRRRPRPDYARKSGYEIKNMVPRGPEKPKQPTKCTGNPEANGVSATLVCGHDRAGVRGDSIGSVLLEAAVEMERLAKRGCRTFVLLLD